MGFCEMFVNLRNTFRKVFTFIHVYVNTFRKFHESPKHSTNNFVQHNLIEIFRYHKYTSRVWIHHNYYSADYWTFVSYPYGILWDIWDTFRKVLPNYPWTRHSSTLVRVSPKKKESNKNLPLDPCLTFFQNFVQMNALSNISNMRRSVSSPDETPRRELKIRRAAEYFWRTSRCFIWWWNTVSNVWYFFSNKIIFEGEIKDANTEQFFIRFPNTH